MRREANFKSELDNCTKMVDSVKKRSTAKGINGYEYPPPDAFWVSRAQLFAYKKTANNEMKYQKSRIAQKPASLIFSTKIDGFLEVCLLLLSVERFPMFSLSNKTTVTTKIRPRSAFVWRRTKSRPNHLRKIQSLRRLLTAMRLQLNCLRTLSWSMRKQNQSTSMTIWFVLMVCAWKLILINLLIYRRPE